MAPRLPPPRASIHYTRVRRRRRVALGILGLIILAVAFVVIYPRISGNSEATGQTAATAASTTEATTASTAPTTTAAATTAAAPAVAPRPTHVGPPSDKTRLKLINTIGGDISPKSVVSSGTGYVTAQNMMYSHTVTVYGAKSMRLIATIPDSVVLAKFGYKGHPGTSQASAGDSQCGASPPKSRSISTTRASPIGS